MTKNIQKITEKKQLSLEGMLTLGRTKEGLRTADFACCENVEIERFSGLFKVDGMHDGNVYMAEMPKRVKNSPIFRDDNSSFSKGKNGKYYFCFILNEKQLEQIPDELVRQATAIAEKIRTILLNDEEDAE